MPIPGPSPRPCLRGSVRSQAFGSSPTSPNTDRAKRIEIGTKTRSIQTVLADVSRFRVMKRLIKDARVSTSLTSLLTFRFASKFRRSESVAFSNSAINSAIRSSRAVVLIGLRSSCRVDFTSKRVGAGLDPAQNVSHLRMV